MMPVLAITIFGPYALVLGGLQVGSRNVVAVRSTLLANARIGNDNIIPPGALFTRAAATIGAWLATPLCQ